MGQSECSVGSHGHRSLRSQTSLLALLVAQTSSCLWRRLCCYAYSSTQSRQRFSLILLLFLFFLNYWGYHRRCSNFYCWLFKLLLLLLLSRFGKALIARVLDSEWNKSVFLGMAFVEGQIAAALPNEGSSTCIMFGASTGFGHHLQWWSSITHVEN